MEWGLLFLATASAFFIQCRFFAKRWKEIRDQWIAIGGEWNEIRRYHLEQEALASRAIVPTPSAQQRELH